MLGSTSVLKCRLMYTFLLPTCHLEVPIFLKIYSTHCCHLTLLIYRIWQDHGPQGSEWGSVREVAILSNLVITIRVTH